VSDRVDSSADGRGVTAVMMMMIIAAATAAATAADAASTGGIIHRQSRTLHNIIVFDHYIGFNV
jgi:hypothetical protein